MVRPVWGREGASRKVRQSWRSSSFLVGKPIAVLCFSNFIAIINHSHRPSNTLPPAPLSPHYSIIMFGLALWKLAITELDDLLQQTVLGQKQPISHHFPMLKAISVLLLVLLSMLQQPYGFIILMALTFTVWISLKGIARYHREASEWLQSIRWSQIRNWCSCGLQWVKYSHMIDRGYEIRSNTNVILHQEEHNNETPRWMLPRQQQLQKIVIDLGLRLQNIKRKSILYLNINAGSEIHQQQPLSCVAPLSFKSCLRLYAFINSIIDDLASLPQHYHNNYFYSAKQITRSVGFVHLWLKPQLKQVYQSIKLIEDIVTAVSRSVAADPLLEHLNRPQAYQQLQQQIESIKAESINTSIANSNQLLSSQQQNKIEEELQTTNEAQKEHTKEEQKQEKGLMTAMERKQFADKLNSLMYLGFMRRREEEIEASARVQNKEQLL